MQNPTYSLSSRSLVDRPDDFSGPRVHVFYAVPKGATDAQLDLGSRIPYSVGAINRWLEGQIGRKVKFDTFQGNLDIQFVRLPMTAAEYTAMGNNELYRLQADIQQSQPQRVDENWLVFYEGAGSGEECGRSTQPTSPTYAGQISAVFLHGNPKYPCWSNTATSADASETVDDHLPMHEIFHGFGASHVPPATATPGSEDFYKQECDIMYTFGTDECTGRQTLDPFRQFYYNANGFADGRANTYASPFLTSPPSQ